MRGIGQRVTASSVTVDGEIGGKIGRGLNLLVGLARQPTAHGGGRESFGLGDDLSRSSTN